MLTVSFLQHTAVQTGSAAERSPFAYYAMTDLHSVTQPYMNCTRMQDRKIPRLRPGRGTYQVLFFRFFRSARIPAVRSTMTRISGTISTTTKDYIINYQDLQGIGMTSRLALPTLIALSSIALSKPTVSSLAVLGEISISGTIIKVDELANALQVCLDSGAKKVLLPITSAGDLGTVPADLVGSFNLIFYNSAEDAVYKALGVE